MKKNIYKYLSEIFEALKEYSKRDDLKINLPKKWQILIEKLFISKITLSNLEIIKVELERINKEQKDNKPIENHLSLNGEINDRKICNSQILKIPQQSEVSAKEVYEKPLNNLEVNIDTNLKAKKENYYKHEISFAKEIILMRDNLNMRKEVLKSSSEPQNSNAYKIIQSSNKETENVLKRIGVYIINQKGLFAQQSANGHRHKTYRG